jgi:hypothetical protein
VHDTALAHRPGTAYARPTAHAINRNQQLLSPYRSIDPGQRVVMQPTAPSVRGLGSLSAHIMALCALPAIVAAQSLKQERQAPFVLLPPGQLVPMPAAGTKSALPLPDYDKDEDLRNDWSKREFPQWGECRWMPTEWGGRPVGPKPGTAAQQQAIRRSIESVITFLKTAPVGNPPIGLCPWPVSAGHDGFVTGGHAQQFSFMLANWPSTILSRTTPNGRVSMTALQHLQFTFNSLPLQRISPEGPFEDSQGEFFAEGQPDGLFQGLPAYFRSHNADESYLVIPRNNRALFRPVSVGRMIRWQLATFDKEIASLRASMASAKAEYDGYFTTAAKAEEARIVAIRIERERATTADAQQRIRANREAEVAASTARLKARWDASTQPDHPFNIATRRKGEAQARLTSLNAADTNASACLIKREQSYVTPDIAASGDAACAFNLVEENPDYYDRSLSPAAPQLLVIARFNWVPPVGGLPGTRYRARWANSHVAWGLDWQKFRRDLLGATEPFDIAKVTPYLGVPRALPDSLRRFRPRAMVASSNSPPLAPAGVGAVRPSPYRRDGCTVRRVHALLRCTAEDRTTQGGVQREGVGRGEVQWHVGRRARLDDHRQGRCTRRAVRGVELLRRKGVGHVSIHSAAAARAIRSPGL